MSMNRIFYQSRTASLIPVQFNSFSDLITVSFCNGCLTNILNLCISIINVHYEFFSGINHQVSRSIDNFYRIQREIVLSEPLF